MKRLPFLLTMVLCVGLPTACARSSKNEDVSLRRLQVAAAADLSTAFRDLVEMFEKDTGEKVEVSFGASGDLAQQIERGARFDVFASANAAFVDEVVRGGACLGDTRAVYAIGRLALWAARGADLPKDLLDLVDPRYGTVALADPDYAPYGAAARQALQTAGVWDQVRSRVTLAGNVEQALELARLGRAQVAVVALSLAVVAEGEYTLVDVSLHDPLNQVAVVCKGNSDAIGGAQAMGRRFVQVLTSRVGRSVLRRNGFRIPGEGAAPD